MPDADGLGGDVKLAGDLGLVDTGGEQLSGAQPAGLKPVTFSLCARRRGAVGMAPILTHPAAQLQLTMLLNPTPKSL
jgi:hypothetical protein